MWHELSSVQTTAAGEITADVRVPAESPWFSGHFPEDPILPGIAQLGIVYDALCRSRGQLPGVAGFSRVKFRRIIRPADRLKMTIAPRKGVAGSYTFRIAAGEEIACSGAIALRASNDPVAQRRDASIPIEEQKP